MEKQNNIQLELFTEPKEAGKNTCLSRKTIFGYIRGYEKTILIIIVIGIIGIVAFCLGVEKGRTVLKQDIAQVSYARPVKQETQKPKLMQEARPTLTGFTIQIASFKTKQFAQKEAESLKKAGFLPSLISKGNYTILCVGNFSTLKDAQAQLAQLQKKYRGSFIRRL